MVDGETDAEHSANLGETVCNAGTLQSCSEGTQRRFWRCQTAGRRLRAGELILSFVPDAEQRVWCTIPRGINWYATGSRSELIDALTGPMDPSHRALLKLHLKRMELPDEQIGKLDHMIATALNQHQDAVIRVAEIPKFTRRENDGSQPSHPG